MSKILLALLVVNWGVPFWLAAPAALVVGVLYGVVIELVVDKIAVVDSVWDAVHTVLRPVGGALIGPYAPIYPSYTFYCAPPMALALGWFFLVPSVRSVVSSGPRTSATLRPRMAASPLVDGRTFARDFEELLARIG